MGQEIAVIEPIPLPDLTKGKMPSLPAWLATRTAGLATNLQIVHGTFRDVKTVPPGMLPSEAQRAAIEAHIRSLNLSLSETPERNQAAAEQALLAVTKMLMVLGGQKNSDLSAEAKAEAYMDALEDVPGWAVDAARKRWIRGDCGVDEDNRPFDYRWPPDPARLRKLAMQQVWMVKGRIAELQDVLDAREYVDCSKELEDGKAAWLGLRKQAGIPGGLDDLSFEKAIEIGRG